MGAEAGRGRAVVDDEDEGGCITGFFGGGLRRSWERSIVFKARVELEGASEDPVEVLALPIREGGPSFLEIEVGAERGTVRKVVEDGNFAFLRGLRKSNSSSSESEEESTSSIFREGFVRLRVCEGTFPPLRRRVRGERAPRTGDEGRIGIVTVGSRSMFSSP